MPDLIHHEPLIGDHLDDVIETALALAVKHDLPVRFTFNDASITVAPGARKRDVLADIEAHWASRDAAYKASPEAKNAAERRAAQVARSQEQHDSLMGDLPVAVRDEALLVQWLADYAGPADDTGVVGRDFAWVADEIEAAGYTRAAALGLPQEEYGKPAVLARWLIGQALDQLRSGLPPHPGLMGRFAGDYRRASRADRAT